MVPRLGGLVVTGSFTIQFQNKEDFGRFCEALRADLVPYSLGGLLTIHLPSARNLEELPDSCQALLREFKEKGYKIRKSYTVTRRDHKSLPSKEEVIKRLQEAAGRSTDAAAKFINHPSVQREFDRFHKLGGKVVIDGRKVVLHTALVIPDKVAATFVNRIKALDLENLFEVVVRA